LFPTKVDDAEDDNDDEDYLAVIGVVMAATNEGYEIL